MTYQDREELLGATSKVATANGTTTSTLSRRHYARPTPTKKSREFGPTPSTSEEKPWPAERSQDAIYMLE